MQSCLVRVASVHFQIFPWALALQWPENGYLGRVILQTYNHSGGLTTRIIDCAISFDATAKGLTGAKDQQVYLFCPCSPPLFDFFCFVRQQMWDNSLLQTHIGMTRVA